MRVVRSLYLFFFSTGITNAYSPSAQIEEPSTAFYPRGALDWDTLNRASTPKFAVNTPTSIPKACEPPITDGVNGFYAMFYPYNYDDTNSLYNIKFMTNGYKNLESNFEADEVVDFELKVEQASSNTATNEIYGVTVNQNFLVELTGHFIPPESADYTFTLAAHSGAILQIGAGVAFPCCDSTGDSSESSDSTMFVTSDDGKDSGPETRVYALKKGLYYPIKMVYVNVNGPISFSVSVSTPSTPELALAKYIYNFDNDEQCSGFKITLTTPWSGSMTSTTTITPSNSDGTTIVEVLTPTKNPSSTFPGTSSSTLETSSTVSKTSSSIPELSSSIPETYSTSAYLSSSLVESSSLSIETSSTPVSSSLDPASTSFDSSDSFSQETVTIPSTTLITVTTCSDINCTIITVTTGQTVVTTTIDNTVTSYTTYCTPPREVPIESSEKTIPSSKLTSCNREQCIFLSTATKSVVTSLDCPKGKCTGTILTITKTIPTTTSSCGKGLCTESLISTLDENVPLMSPVKSDSFSCAITTQKLPTDSSTAVHSIPVLSTGGSRKLMISFTNILMTYLVYVAI
ncbi:hypothetical protein CAAN1_15S00166 [[Candida] anglica]|uniref:PA14 domain-containing protein n=1 Tax=[Candida] anglica TaxID=148631 RepID=A0ABP0E7S4_9ASCO